METSCRSSSSVSSFASFFLSLFWFTIFKVWKPKLLFYFFLTLWKPKLFFYFFTLGALTYCKDTKPFCHSSTYSPTTSFQYLSIQGNAFIACYNYVTRYLIGIKPRVNPVATMSHLQVAKATSVIIYLPRCTYHLL